MTDRGRAYRSQSDHHRYLYGLSDYLMLNIGWLGFNVARFFTLPKTLIATTSLESFLLESPLLAGQLIIPVVMVLIYALFGSYNRPTTLLKSRLDETLNTLLVSTIGMVGVFFTVLINDNIPERVTNYELMLILLGCFFLPVWIMRIFLVTSRARKIWNKNMVIPTIIIGAEPDMADKISRINETGRYNGMSLMACVDTDNSNPDEFLAGLPVVHDGDLRSVCKHLRPGAAIIMTSSKNLSHVGDVLNTLYPLDIPVFITPDIYSILLTRPRLRSVISEPVVDITNAGISPAEENFKRLGDIIVSALSLVVLSPVLAAIAIAVHLDSKGPVFYRQERVGYHRKPFKIIKFRSMSVDAEQSGPALSSDSDPRVTRVGRFLRKYRLDELPQFWNVLIGQMSLVGPRPERDHYVRRIMATHPAYSLIHQVRPGITSWGMVSYGYASNVEQMVERMAYDLLYIQNVSLGVDLKILFHTIATVLGGKGK